VRINGCKIDLRINYPGETSIHCCFYLFPLGSVSSPSVFLKDEEKFLFENRSPPNLIDILLLEDA